MKKIWSTVTLSMVLAGSLFAQNTIISDDFTSGTVSKGFARLVDNDIDVGWRAALSDYWGYTSAWEIVSGQLQHDATNNAAGFPNYIPGEEPVVQVVSYSGGASNGVEISFDYTVAEGDTLYVHLWGIDGAADFDGDWIANIETGAGSLVNETTGAYNDGAMLAYNLKNGSNASGIGAASEALAALAGNGTFSASINIQAFLLPTIDDAADFEYYLLGFGKAEDGTAGTTSIDNILLQSADVAAPPSGLVWENDMSTDPVGGPEPNWVVRSGSYTLGGGLLTLSEGAWSAVLDTNPFDLFKGTTQVDLEWRATSAGAGPDGLGAGIWCNIDNDAPDYGAIHFDAILETNNTQTVVIFEGYNTPLATIPGFGPGMLTLSATLDSYAETVSYSISDGSTTINDSLSYTPAATAGSTVGATLFTAQPAAEFDYVRIAANAEANLIADPDALVMDLAQTDISVSNSLVLRYSAPTNMTLNISIANESHPGSFSVLSGTSRALPALGVSTLEFEFDRSVNNLAGGDVATGQAILAWSQVDGSDSGQLVVPLTGNVAEPAGAMNNWTGAGGGIYWGDPDNWSLGRVPGASAADSAYIEGGAEVTVATNAPDTFVPLPQLVVRDAAMMGSTLNIQADMPSVETFEVGYGSYIGYVNHSAGAINVATTLVGYIAMPTNSVYSLTGGSVMTDKFSIPEFGILEIDGGTFTVDNADDGGFIPHYSLPSPLYASGLLRIKSGTYQTGFNGAVGDNYTCAVEISGGTVEIGTQGYYTGGLTILGNDATVNIDFLNAANEYVAATINYVLDADGVSTIDGSGSWCNLSHATFNIDGSAYTGGTQDIVLFRSTNMATTSDVYNVTGFAPDVTTEIVVTSDAAGAGVDTVVLKINVPGYEGWIPGFGLAGAEAAWDYDADFDTEINWYEYVMGGDPTNPAVRAYVPTAQVVEISGADYYEYVYVRRRDSGAELDYIPEFATALPGAVWSDVSGSEFSSGVLDDEYESVTNRVDMTGKPEGFMHLIINQL